MTLPDPDSHPWIRGWRDPGRLAASLSRGRPGLAWEVLRRDAGYVRFSLSRRVRHPSADALVIAADADAARHWGLHFRGGSAPRR